MLTSDGVTTPATTPRTARTETVTVEDGGGVDYKISVKWNKKYRDAAGTHACLRSTT